MIRIVAQQTLSEVDRIGRSSRRKDALPRKGSQLGEVVSVACGTHRLGTPSSSCRTSAQQNAMARTMPMGRARASNPGAYQCISHLAAAPELRPNFKQGIGKGACACKSRSEGVPRSFMISTKCCCVESCPWKGKCPSNSSIRIVPTDLNAAARGTSAVRMRCPNEVSE